MDVLEVAVELVEEVSPLVELSVVVLVMVVVEHLVVLVELLVVGVVTKVVSEDNKEFLNIKVIIFHLVI